MGTGIRIVGGSNVRVEDNTVDGFDDGIVVENTTEVSASRNHVKTKLDLLKEDYPPLQNISDEELTAEIATLQQGAVSAEAVEASKFGRWLGEQKFVEWATLASRLLQSFRPS